MKRSVSNRLDKAAQDSRAFRSLPNAETSAQQQRAFLEEFAGKVDAERECRLAGTVLAPARASLAMLVYRWAGHFAPDDPPPLDLETELQRRLAARRRNVFRGAGHPIDELRDPYDRADLPLGQRKGEVTMETTERSATERPTAFPPEPDLDAAFDDFVAALRAVLAEDPDALPELATGAGPAASPTSR